jgi:hypothetical protein
MQSKEYIVLYLDQVFMSMKRAFWQTNDFLSSGSSQVVWSVDSSAWDKSFRSRDDLIFIFGWNSFNVLNIN